MRGRAERPKLSREDEDLLAELRRESLAVLERTLGHGREVALLDTPRHRNLGDSLIWAGMVGHLEDLGHRTVHHTDLGRFRDSDVRWLPRDAVVVLRGGGNLGDLYPAEEGFRRHLVRTLRNRDIVVFPQTMYYQSRDEERRAARDYSAHGRLTLLARDTESLHRMRTVMPDVATAFCPDAALRADVPGTGPLPGGRVAVLARGDAEATPADAGHGGGDWSPTAANSFLWTAVMAEGRIHRRLPDALRRLTAGELRRANSRLLALNVAAAARQYRGARAVATNRLHGHILACLLGIPHWAADNSYGKVSRIFADYTGRFGTAHLAGSLADAVRLAEAVPE